MALKVGNDMKLYHNTGTDASPTWVEIAIVGDVSVPLTVNDAEVDLRTSTYLMNLPSKIASGLEFFLANDIGGTVFDALRTAFFARTVQQYASANAAIATSGTQYFKAFMHLTGFPWAQPTQEISSHEVTASLSYHEESGSLVEPAWATTP